MKRHIAQKANDGITADTLTRVPATTAMVINASGLKPARDGIECATSYGEAEQKQAEAQKASWLKDRLFGGLCHRHLLFLNIPMLKGFVNGY